MYKEDFLPNRKKGEKIIFFLRRHWFTYFLKIMMYVFFLILPILLYFVTRENGIDFKESELIYALVVIGLSAYYLYVWMFLFNEFIDHHLDVWIVTTHRIIDFEQKGLFARVFAEHNLDKVQDVKVEVNGILPTLFNYGNVQIQTAGTLPNFIFRQVGNPYKIAKEINYMAEEATKNT